MEINNNNVEGKKRIDFSQGSIKMLIIKMAIPGMIMMFSFGLYTFADSILSVQFAPGAYANDEAFQGIVSTTPFEVEDLVRTMMGPTSVIVNTIGAIAVLFAQGAATRQAINLGRGDIEKAKNNIRVGSMYGLGLTFIMMPILYFISEPWISSQMGDFDVLAHHSAGYANIIVLAAPFIVINQLMTFALRNEGNNKAILVGMLLPIGLNLFLDWLFMHVFGMGIDGGAWATFASHIFTFAILVFFAIKDHSEFVRFKVMFGLKMNHVSIIGILLVGMAPFLSNMAFAITQTMANNNANAISEIVYPDNTGTLFALSAGVWPIFMLALPVLFGFVQGVVPIAAYNYGKKNFDRVKEAIKWSVIFSFVVAAIMYVLIGVLMAETLLGWLGTNETFLPIAKHAVLIALLPLFTFSISNGAMIFFGSTDRVWRNLYSNISFGIIWYIPMLYVVRAIAIANPSYEYWYWYTWLFTSICSILVLGPMLVHGIKHIKAHTKSLDEIVISVEQKLIKKFQSKKIK